MLTFLRTSSDKKLQRTLVSTLVLSLIISIGALILLQHTISSDRYIIEDDLEDALRFVNMKSYLESGESSYRGYLLSGQTLFLDRFTEMDTSFAEHLDALIKTTRDEAETKNLNQLKEMHSAQRVKIKVSINMREKQLSQAEIESYFENEIVPLRRDIVSLIESMQKQKDEEFSLTKNETVKSSKRAFWIIIGATGLSLCLVILSALVVSQRLASLYFVSKTSSEELSKTVQTLQQVNSNLGQFAAVAAHDLKSPLRTVSNYVQFLSTELKEGKSTNVEDVMRSILDSTKRMRLLVDDLLGYSVLENIAIKPEPVSLKDTISKVTESLNSEIVESRAKIEYQNLPNIIAEPKSLEVLLQNLISNAIKYRREVPPEIHIKAEESDSSWTISVEDNGCGFKAENAQDIFRPFKRLVQNTHIPGTGLGLAICKKIIDRHRGKIWFESSPGKGSIFSFSFPKAAVLSA